MIYGITLILLSILAVPSLILSKRPDAQKILDEIAPYQGWIGLVFCAWGILSTLSALLSFSMMSILPVWWLTWLASSIVEAVLGFMLGYSVINNLILSNNEQAKAKGEQLLAKLAPIQAKLGLVGIALGIWTIIAHIAFTTARVIY